MAKKKDVGPASAETPVVAPVSVLPPEVANPSAADTVAAKQAIERDRQARADAVRVAVEEACGRNRCKIIGVVRKVEISKGAWADAVDVTVVADD